MNCRSISPVALALLGLAAGCEPAADAQLLESQHAGKVHAGHHAAVKPGPGLMLLSPQRMSHAAGAALDIPVVLNVAAAGSLELALYQPGVEGGLPLQQWVQSVVAGQWVNVDFTLPPLPQGEHTLVLSAKHAQALGDAVQGQHWELTVLVGDEPPPSSAARFSAGDAGKRVMPAQETVSTAR